MTTTHYYSQDDKHLEELQSKLNTVTLSYKLAQLPKIDLSLDNDDDNKDDDKFEELKNRIISQKLKVGTKYRFASLDSESDEFVSYFLIKGDTVNGRDWGVPSESIPQNIHTFKGMPFVITSNEFVADSIYGDVFDHPQVLDAPKVGLAREGRVNVNDIELIKRFQDGFRVGTIEDVIKVGDSWRAIIRKSKQFMGKQFPPFCSPAIFRLNDTDPDDSIMEWTGLHLAGLMDRPAYGDIALYKGQCTGTLEECKPQFRHASLSAAEPCKVMQLRRAMATDSIKSAISLSQNNTETQVQNVFQKECPPGATRVNGKCLEQKKKKTGTKSKGRTIQYKLSPKQASLFARMLTEHNPVKYAQLKAFTNSSSFVGNVRYNTETQQMRILLGGRPYNFCGVPARKFESLRGATSTGKAFNDIIKGQHDC